MDVVVDDLRDIWEAHADHDPLWSILSDQEKKGRKWKIGEFFEKGDREVEIIFDQISRLNIELKRNRALDFGCGVGRVTQPLAKYFDKVIGVDISERMVDLASKLNRCGENVQYLLNQTDGLSMFRSEDFDFIYSSRVLQHIPPDLTIKYLSEFFRILKSKGLLIFQLPSHLCEESRAPVMANKMPDDAYSAEITVDPIPVGPILPSTEVNIRVEVKNTSKHNWEQSDIAPLRLGNHWWSGDGETLLIQDDGRSTLPDVLRGGEKAEAILTVKAPDRSGAYQCEIDIVHEMITWFKDRGSATTKLNFFVASAAPSVSREGSAAAGDALNTSGERVPDAVGKLEFSTARDLYESLPNVSVEPKPFPMYGIRKEKVVEFIERNNAKVIKISEDASSGDEWHSFRYFVRKSSIQRSTSADS